MSDQSSKEAISPTNTDALLESYLDSFSALVKAQSIESSDGSSYPWAWEYVGGESEFTLVVSVMIHGNEVGPLEGLLDIIDGLESGKIKFCGRLICLIGNPEAARLGKRFVEVDLNRVFEKEDLDPHAEAVVTPHENKRAQELLPYLDRADLYVDFHQTILDSAQSFYITPWSKSAWQWMRLMGGAKVWVTRNPQQNSGGFKCADEYVRQRGKPSIALELGALGFSSKARSGVWKSLNRAMKGINQIVQGESLEALVENEPDLTFYQTSYRCPFDRPELILKDGLVNFTSVQQGESLSASEDSDDALIAPQTGMILFPKYPLRDENGNALQPLPKEIYRIVSELDGHPLELWENK